MLLLFLRWLQSLRSQFFVLSRVQGATPLIYPIGLSIFFWLSLQQDLNLHWIKSYTHLYQRIGLSFFGRKDIVWQRDFSTVGDMMLKPSKHQIKIIVNISNYTVVSLGQVGGLSIFQKIKLSKSRAAILCLFY